MDRFRGVVRSAMSISLSNRVVRWAAFDPARERDAGHPSSIKQVQAAKV
jgi:hypothetical protein